MTENEKEIFWRGMFFGALVLAGASVVGIGIGILLAYLIGGPL